MNLLLKAEEPLDEIPQCLKENIYLITNLHPNEAFFGTTVMFGKHQVSYYQIVGNSI